MSTSLTTAAPANHPQYLSFRLEKLTLFQARSNQAPFPIELFNSPCLSQLQELTLQSFTLGESEINALFGEDIGKLKHFTLLNLKESKFKSYDAFKALAQSPHLTNLHTLALCGNGLSPPYPELSPPEVLFRSPYLWTPKLKHLELSGFNPVDRDSFPNSVITTLETANFKLETIDCGYIFPTLDQLTTSSCFSPLKKLPPSVSLFDDDEDWDSIVERFVQSSNLSYLTTLEFPSWSNGVRWTYEQIVTLLTSPMMSNDLIEFIFPSYRLDLDADALIEVLVTARVVPGDETTPLKYGKLQRLILGWTTISSRGIELIVQNLPQLTHLDLGFCGCIDDDAIAALIAHEHDDPRYPYPALPNLVCLYLDSCSITEEGFITLSKSQLLDQLELVDLLDNLVESNLGTQAILKTPLFSNMKSISIAPFAMDTKSLTHLDSCDVVFMI